MEARFRATVGHRYRIDRLLGEGGMAVVFLAHDLRHDRPVAVKLLRRELGDVLGPDLFLREIRVAAQLNHPNILGLHDSGDAGGILYYVMPYVEGDSLRQRIDREGRLAVDEAVRIAAEVADGLAHAHELGIVHRDIKPANILLLEGHAQIADFGIARAVAGAGRSGLTTGLALGTPTYMSPEQATGSRLDYRTDLYSLGCTLYEMLAGEPPFQGPTPQAVMALHASGAVPLVRDRRPDVPAALAAIVARAMAKMPAERFSTAAQFRAALEAVPSRRIRLPLTARRAWRAGGVAAALVVVALGYEVLSLRPRSEGASAREPLSVVVRHVTDPTGRLGSTAERLTGNLIRSLYPVPALRVVAGALVRELRDVSLDSLWARFAPDRFVTGSLAVVGDSLHVTVEVVEPSTGQAIADTVVTVRRGPAEVSAAAELLSVFVRRSFWADLERRSRRARVRDAVAWDLVEQARLHAADAAVAITFRRDREGLRSLDLADSLLREARRRDGGSDVIQIDLARNAHRRAFYVEYLHQALPARPAGLPDPGELRRRALIDLDRMVRERGGTAEALELRGEMREGLYRALGADSLLDAAIADYRAATDIGRHRASAWALLASAHLAAGANAEALLAVDRAADADVFRLSRRALLRARFDAALRAERTDLADAACREGMAEAPGDQRFQDCLVELWSRTRSDRGSATAARSVVDSLTATDPGSLSRAMRELWVAQLLARAGLADSADAVARRAISGAPPGWTTLLLESAYLRLLRNDVDSAVALIGAAVRQDPTARRAVIGAPWFRSLRGDRRFPRAATGLATPL